VPALKRLDEPLKGPAKFRAQNRADLAHDRDPLA